MIFWVKLKKTTVAWTPTMATKKQMVFVGPVGESQRCDAYNVHVQKQLNVTLSLVIVY